MSIAFYTGVAGMLASQSFMDATANNMANVNTVGYKTQNATFEDLLYTKMNIHSNYYNREDDDPNGEVVEGDVRCLDEYRTYEKKKNGGWGAITGKHDDLLMTRAIGLHICFYEMEIPKIVKRYHRNSTRKRAAISEATI